MIKVVPNITNLKPRTTETVIRVIDGRPKLILRPTDTVLRVNRAVLNLIAGAQQGPAGPPGADGQVGPEGPQGPAGSGGDLTYIHNQLIASATWTVNHNLNKYPSVFVSDSANDVVYGDIEYTDVNTLTITFSAAFGGRAYLN